MEITLLGTSSGTPTKSRNVSGAIVSSLESKKWYLVDCGEGTQHQVLHTRYSLSNLQAIFISHVHGDHCYGLPGLLASAAMSGRLNPLKIVCPGGVKKFMEVMVKETQMKLPYEVKFIDIESITSSLKIEKIKIDIIRLSHRVPSFGFKFSGFFKRKRQLDIEKLIAENIPKGELWGRVQSEKVVVLSDGRKIESDNFLMAEEKSKKVIICGDNDKPELLMPHMTDVDLVVHESTYTKDIALKVGSNPQHSYAALVASFAKKVGLRNLILTHFSPRYADDIGGSVSILDIESEARSIYDGNLFLAKDLDCYRMDRNGMVELKKPHSKVS